MTDNNRRQPTEVGLLNQISTYIYFNSWCKIFWKLNNRLDKFSNAFISLKKSTSPYINMYLCQIE